MDFKTRQIETKTMISDEEIAKLTGINYVDVINSLWDYKGQDGQHDTVYADHDGFFTVLYADKTAFYALSTRFAVEESIQQAVLAALGEFYVPVTSEAV